MLFQALIGSAGEVAAEIAEDPDLFDAVFEGMLAGDPVLRMRAADAVEKATRRRPALLRPYKERLIGEVAAVEQQEVRWHVAQMLPRLPLDAQERLQVVALLKTFLKGKSKILKTNVMQAMADLAWQDERLRPSVIPLIEELTQTGSPAMRARGRKLLDVLQANQEDLSSRTRREAYWIRKNNSSCV